MPEHTTPTWQRLDAIARLFLVAFFALIPFFFIPFSWLTALQSKIILAASVLLVVAVLWVVARILEGGVRMPWNLFFGAAALLPIVYAISAVVNGFSSVSLVGAGIEADTLATVCLAFSALALTAMLFMGGGVKAALRWFFAGALTLEIIHVVHVIVPSVSFGGVLAGKTGNAFGTWHEFTMIIGLVLVMALALMRSSVAVGLWRYVVASAGIIAVPILLVSNFADVWIAVALSSMVLFLVHWYQTRAPLSIAYARAEWVTLAVAVIAVIGVFFGARLVSVLPERISVVQVEVRPSWQGTFEIGEQSLSSAKAFIFGVGPNTFVRQWGLHKPIEVNQTPFWNADFNVGVAPIPTSFISLGILGVIAWLAFIFAAVWMIVRLWMSRSEAPIAMSTIALTIAAVYLLGFHLVSVPGTMLGLLMFLLFGLLIAAITPSFAGERRVAMAASDWKNTVRIVATGLIALIAIIAALGVLRAILADAMINRAIVGYNAQRDLQKASNLIALSLRIQPVNDRAHRSAVELGLLKLQQIISSQDPNQESARTALQSTLEETIRHGLEAVEINSRDYQNWLQLASLYSQLAGAQIQGAYDNARAAYVRAQTENPTSPLPWLNLGQLDAIQGKYDDALTNLGKAVELKPDLAAAYYLASQIYVAKNDPVNALKAAAFAAQYAPNDPLAWYNAGAIAYAAGGYQDAALAMQQALALQPQYANAMYVLGLSLYQLQRPADALTVFEALDKLDPGQPIVQHILGNLRAGRALDAQAQEAAPTATQ